MQTIENVVIAAAGMGKRLGMGMPKALVEVSGKKIIEYQLSLFKDVPNVFMVVGFCDTEVIDFVKNIRRDVIFVRNTNFKHTKTLESFYLAAQLIKGWAVFIDGDMIIPTSSFKNFSSHCVEEMQIAVTKRISDDPVYALVDSANKVTGFSYTQESLYEWANVVYMKSELLQGGRENVFEFLERFLPAKAVEIDRLEIDTPEDLQYAETLIIDGYLK